MAVCTIVTVCQLGLPELILVVDVSAVQHSCAAGMVGVVGLEQMAGCGPVLLLRFPSSRPGMGRPGRYRR